MRILETIVLVFIVHHAIRLVCHNWAKHNIAECSMVDERFLV